MKVGGPRDWSPSGGESWYGAGDGGRRPEPADVRRPGHYLDPEPYPEPAPAKGGPGPLMILQVLGLVLLGLVIWNLLRASTTEPGVTSEPSPRVSAEVLEGLPEENPDKAEPVRKRADEQKNETEEEHPAAPVTATSPETGEKQDTMPAEDAPVPTTGRFSGLPMVPEVGDCLMDPGHSHLARAPCAEPHFAEVVYVGVAPAELHPDIIGDGGTRGVEQIHLQCAKAFLAYTGTEIDSGAYGVLITPPTPMGWAAGDRAAVCAAFANEGELTGSIRYVR